MTKVERLLLVNQLLILEKLYPDDAKHYSMQRQALQEGYTRQYDEAFKGIDDDELSEEQCKQVVDILDMYRAITTAAEGLPADSKLRDDYNLKFRGFDGNDPEEGPLMSYTRHLIVDRGLWAELRDQSDDDFNSHDPLLADYRKMQREWQKSGKPHKLTEADLARILATAR